VLDEGEAELLRQRVLPRVLESFYTSMTPGQTQLADCFGFGRDDRGLEELVLELHSKVQSHAYPHRWLEEQRQSWASLPEDGGETEFGKALLTRLARKARHWADLLTKAGEELRSDNALERAYGPAFASGTAQLEALAEAAETGWDAAAGRLPDFPRLSPARKCEDPALKEKMQTLWNRCKKESAAFCAILETTGAETGEDLRRSAPAMEALLALCVDFSAAYQQEKLRRNVTDFSDQEHYAVRLLLGEDGRPTPLAVVMSERYLEVMVDEYQDTNQVQNCIFDALARGGRSLFTVGDVKQSIYRFRLADPTIFLEQYRRYPDAAEAEEGEPRRILLSQNFRSRKEVLDAANFVFSAIMSREMGEVEYGEAERLYFGAAYLPPREDCLTEFHLLLPPQDDGEAEKVPAALLEARMAADRIASLLSEGFPVTDEDSGELRPCRAEDIVILMRSPGPRLRHYARALTERGIPCATQENEDFFSAMEVAVMCSLLEILDNPRQDVPLIAVLRSPLAGFSPDRLALIRGRHPEGDFYEALAAFGEEDCEEFLTRLADLRSLARDMSVHRLIWRIYNQWNVLGVFGAMSGGGRRRENLVALYEHAKSFESAGYKGLFAFVTHLRRLLESGEQPVTASGASSGGVQIMSIHKSKGLEFPIVLLTDLGKRFNRADLQTPVLVHPRLGLGPLYIDLDRRIRYPTIAREAVSGLVSRESRSEEMRVLYVGMTRAKEKLILTASMPAAGRRMKELGALSALPVPAETVDGGRSMAEWILLPLLRRWEAAPLRDLAGQEAEDFSLTEDALWQVFLHKDTPGICLPAGTEAGGNSAADAPALPVNREALDFVYPYAAACTAPTKITATQLKGREKDREIVQETIQPYVRRDFSAPRFLSGRRPLTGAERGTATHLVMQHLPLKEDTDVGAVVEDLAARRFLTREQAEAVDQAAVRRFLASPLASELQKADRVEREFRFSLLMPGEKYFPELDGGEEVLLQGVVDLFAVRDGGVTVVDFKTDYVTEDTLPEKIAHYRPQLEAYSAALERILELPVKHRILYFFCAGQAVEV
jgi:ATP-dependent helicase/nuclease subunit A